MNNANVAQISNFYSTERFAQSLRNVMPSTSALASGPGLNTVTNLQQSSASQGKLRKQESVNLIIGNDNKAHQMESRNKRSSIPKVPTSSTQKERNQSAGIYLFSKSVDRKTKIDRSGSSPIRNSLTKIRNLKAQTNKNSSLRQKQLLQVGIGAGGGFSSANQVKKSASSKFFQRRDIKLLATNMPAGGAGTAASQVLLQE